MSARHSALNARHGALHQRLLRLARAAWLLLALTGIGLYMISLPGSIRLLQTVCATPPCDPSQLTPQAVAQLQAVGLSAEFAVVFYTLSGLIFSLVNFAVGGMIFKRRSNDGMALLASLMLVIFLGVSFNGALDVPPQSSGLLRWASLVVKIAAQASAILFFYLFPDGHFAPRWMRWPALILVVMSSLALLFPAIAFLNDGVVFFPVILSWILVQVYRYRRVSNPTQRQQTKWVVFGLAIALGGFTLFNLLFTLTANPEGHLPNILLSMTADLLFNGVMLVIPVSIMISILRAHLWDIDLLIRRTLIYSAMTVDLGLVYFASIVVLEAVFRAITGETSDVAIVISTLVISILSAPLYRRIQSDIDRRFYRKAYNTEVVLGQFTARARNEVDLNRLSGDLLNVVGESMQPESVSLWLRKNEG